jgi:Cu/Ag efflux protein CusF
MKKLILAVVLTSVAGWAVAQEPTSPAQQPQPPAQTAKDSKEMTATVVATDPTVKTITFKKEAAGVMSEQTLPVDDKALANLKTIKTGEKVKLILKADPTTGKESVTSIEKPKS